MKTLFFLLIFSTLWFSCKKEETAADTQKTVQLTEKQKQIVAQSNSFGMDFFRSVYALSGSDHNLMVSPLSVSMALGMTRNGASGSTLEAMTQVLGMNGMADNEVNESYKYILETFASLDPKVKISIANSIWYRNTFTVEQNFLNTNQQYFNARVEGLDFNDPGSVGIINGWVSSNTNGLIPTIIDAIPSEMVMYLINAVYFKGQWKYTFDKKNTTDKTFKLADESSITTPSMLQHATLDYFKGAGFEAVDLPYNQGNYSMTVLLPDQGQTVASVIDQLSMENWNSWKQRLLPKDIQIQLPKFRFKYNEKNMVPALSDMGMAIAFDPDAADFTRINSDGGLYISEIKHKTYIATDEEGTEAAAVTSVGISVTSVNPDDPYNLLIDRPFVFFISEKSTGSILFIGTVMNPASEE